MRARAARSCVLLREAMARCPTTLRTAVLLRDIQELSYQEIADQLRLPEGTVKSRINRGRTELARQIRRLRGQPTGAGRPRRPARRGGEWQDEPHHRTRAGRRHRPRRRNAADVSAAGRFLDAVTTLIARAARKVLIDLSTVTYVDSATIGCLMDLYRQASGGRRHAEARRRPEARRDDADDDRRAQLHRDAPGRAERRQELRGLSHAHDQDHHRRRDRPRRRPAGDPGGALPGSHRASASSSGRSRT